MPEEKDKYVPYEWARLVVELAGEFAISYGAWLVRPWLGVMVLGVFLLLASYGISKSLEKLRAKKEPSE